MLVMRLQLAQLARLFVLPLVIAGVGIAAAPAPAPAPAAADLFDDLYARSQPIDATVKTIHASFTETTESPLLRKPLVAEGTLQVVRPHSVEMVYTKPERKTVTIKDGQLLLTAPDRNFKQERDISQALGRIDKYFVDKSPKELRKHFTIAASEDKERAGTYRIDMTPKRKQIEQGLTRLELWLRKDTLLLDAMRMHFPGDAIKMMEFRDVVVNKGAASGSATPSTPRSGGAR
jgi:outer membrane lipoprotein-sorting protein